MNSITKEAAGVEHTELAADNAHYIESLYEQFLSDPSSVDNDWQDYFKQYQSPNDAKHNEIKDQFLLLARNQTAIKVALPLIAQLRAHQQTVLILNRWVFSS